MGKAHLLVSVIGAIGFGTAYLFTGGHYYLVLTLGALCLFPIALAFMAIFWYFETYARIFFITGVGEAWNGWNAVQRFFFILGLAIWPISVIFVSLIYVLGALAMISLAVSAIRAVFR